MSKSLEFRLRSSVITKACWQFLREDPELSLLPVAALVGQLLVAAAFFVPFVVLSYVDERLHIGLVSYVLLGVYYFAAAFVTVFSNTALVCAVDQKMRGLDPTLKSALATAWTHRRRILQWAAISATISFLMRLIEERAGIIGTIVVGLFDIAWSLVTFLVIPVYVVEGLGPFESVKRSKALFIQKWGLRLRAGFRLGVSLFLIGAAFVVIGVAGVFAGGPVMVLCLFIAAIGLLATVVLSQTLSGIFQTVLYYYAAQGVLPPQFDENVVAHAYEAKN